MPGLLCPPLMALRSHTKRNNMDTKNLLIVVLLAIVVLQFLGVKPLANEEIVEWTDYRGNKMRVRVERSLH